MKRSAIHAIAKYFAKVLGAIMAIMTRCAAQIGKQLAYLSLETPGGALKPSAEQGDIGERVQPPQAWHAC